MGCNLARSTQSLQSNIADSKEAKRNSGKKDSAKKQKIAAEEPVRRDLGPNELVKAAMVIQKWYRMYRSRWELRKIAAWNIYQFIEYQGEHAQLQLSNFFNEVIGGFSGEDESSGIIRKALDDIHRTARTQVDASEEDKAVYLFTNLESVPVPDDYKGLRVKFPLNRRQLQDMVEFFRSEELLQPRYVMEILLETRKKLMNIGTINTASTELSGQLTICGDLHGKLDDLLIIFYKNGLPASNNPYVFNGDFVDRGPHSVEISMLLFSSFLLYPNAVFINRGNHEDYVMNLRYGFVKEIMSKYKKHATQLLRLYQEVFSWLPLGTIVDKRVLCCHGGISNETNINYLKKIDRHKFISILRPPPGCTDDNILGGGDMDSEASKEWKQVVDLLWSDPKMRNGCEPNTFRGGGCFYGPDISSSVLARHNLELLIRSHECKPDGYEWTHDRRVLTIFSASNYYEKGSNKGAYVKLLPGVKLQIVQFMASKTQRKLTIRESVNNVAMTAMHELRERIISHREDLLRECAAHDPHKSGLIPLKDWVSVMQAVIDRKLPWRMLREQIVRADGQMIVYESTFSEFHLTCANTPNVAASFYRNVDNLETIFRLIDGGNKGAVTVDEFVHACETLNQAIDQKARISQEDIRAIARTVDLNQDGLIDLNEFVESFRLVDRLGRPVLPQNRKNTAPEQKGFHSNSDAVFQHAE